eukprot:TRINITY_DN36056_c0_g1_i1.p1 TRINITY_DN36056_c0_g1~~TRINITY_DN36056_c0_g1_i1.p1  ORF type:complete len:992 (+),score=349.92 TRINITY_DN36056_c0_g1_i1:138-3113(+)
MASLRNLLQLVLLCAVVERAGGHNAYSAPIKWVYTPMGSDYIEMYVTSDDTHAFVAASDEGSMSQMYAISLEDGTLNWNTGTGAMAVEQPVTYGGLVYSVAGQNPSVLRCFPAESSQQQNLWSWNDHRSSSIILSSVSVAPSHNLVYVVSVGCFTEDSNSIRDLPTVHTLFALWISGDQKGKVAWQHELSSGVGGLDPMHPPLAPTYDKDTDRVFAAGAINLFAFDPVTGDVLWKVDGLPVVAAATVTQNIAIVSVVEDGDPSVKGYNTSSGVHVWCMHTQSVASRASVFTDGSGRFAYSTTSWTSLVGTQPAGVHAINPPHLTFGGYSTSKDACANGTGFIVTLDGAFATPESCRDGCHDQHCNATAFTWFRDSSCKCRLDQVWETVDDQDAVSGKWLYPSSNWSLTQEKVGWSQPTVKDETVYVSASNTTHEMVFGLRGGRGEVEKMWMHTVELPTEARMWMQPTPPAVSASTLSLLVGSQNGSVFSYCIDNTTPVPPVFPTPAPPESNPWYTQTRCIVGITLGVTVLLLLVCFCGCTTNQSNLDSPARKYQMVSKLGSGSYGVVYLVRRRQDKALCALKYLNCDSDEQQERALLEFTTMRQYQGHPNMIRVIETFMNWQDVSTEERLNEERPLLSPAGLNGGGVESFLEEIKKFSNPKYVCLLMPFYKRGDLKQFAMSTPDPIPEDLLLDFTAQISSLMQHFHDRDEPLIHRDLKPENVLMSDDCRSVIVTDFGLAKKMHNQYCCTRAGTLCYMAPECWAHHYGKEADMWALGCIMYAVAMKRLDEHNIRVMFSEALQVENFQRSVEAEMTAAGYPLLGTVVASLLEPDYHVRPPASSVLMWLKVPKYDPNDPSPPVRAPSSKISIPPLTARHAPKPFAPRISSHDAHNCSSHHHGYYTSSVSETVGSGLAPHLTHVRPAHLRADERLPVVPNNRVAATDTHERDHVSVQCDDEQSSSNSTSSGPSKPLPTPVPGMAGVMRIQAHHAA